MAANMDPMLYLIKSVYSLGKTKLMMYVRYEEKYFD
jgi:hypothetical protein